MARRDNDFISKYLRLKKKQIIQALSADMIKIKYLKIYIFVLPVGT